VNDHPIDKMDLCQILPSADSQDPRFELLANQLDDLGNAKIF
jgi:hypothetical protein